MSHYYSKYVNVKSEEVFISFHYHDQVVKLIGDNGVFSKQRVDYGSRVLLDTIDIHDEKSLLDVGCGYGTLGISLKVIHPQLYVEMIDINERAIHLSNKAIELNNLTDIQIYQSDIYEKVENHFDIIISNPPIRAGKKVVFGIIDQAYDYLNNLGYLMIVIQKKQGAPSAKKEMEKIFGNCEIVKRDKGYYILKSIKHI